MTAETEEKTERLVEMLGRESAGGVLLNAQHNFAWLTCGASNGIDLSRENGAASLLVTSEGKRYILANNIEMPRVLAEQVAAADFEPVEFSWQEEKAKPSLPVDMARRIAGEVVTDLPLAPGSRTVENGIAKCRSSLTSDEASRLRLLGKDAGKALDSVAEMARPGSSERSIAELMRAELSAAGITSIVTLVATDDRIAAYRHPVPTENCWQQTLMLVTCARRKGLIVSLSRILLVGTVTDDLQRKTEAAAFVNASLWHATRPGAGGAHLYATAAAAYAAAGYAGEIDKHHQGGAAGYRTRDWVAHPNSAETVQRDQAFAWNPSITGTKVEETVLVTETNVEVMTTSEKFPSIPVEIDGVTYLSPGILSV